MQILQKIHRVLTTWRRPFLYLSVSGRNDRPFAILCTHERRIAIANSLSDCRNGDFAPLNSEKWSKFRQTEGLQAAIPSERWAARIGDH